MLDGSEIERLRPALGVDQPLAAPEMASLGSRHTVAAGGAVLGAFTLLAEFAATVLDPGERCPFPSCH